MFRSLRARLVLLILMLVIVMMAVVGAFLINRTARFQLEDYSSKMAEAFRSEDFVLDLQRAADDKNAPQAMKSVLRAYSGLLGIDTVQRNFYILDADTGESLAGSDDRTSADLPLTSTILAALNGRVESSTRIDDDYMDTAVPISGKQGQYVVYIKDTKDNLQQLIAQIFSLILQALLIGVVLSVLLSLLVSKAITTPLERLTQSTKQMAAGQFVAELEVTGDDEISILTRTFNTMAMKLQQSLEEIGAERDKLGTLFLHMTDGVASFSRDGVPIQANPAAERLLGISFAQMHSYGEVFGALAPLFEVLSVKEPRYIQRELDLLGRTLLIYLAPFGKVATEGVMAVIHDVTEQKRLDDLRREFVSNVSHELRTPLTNIRSYAETLHDTADLPPETARTFSQVILNEAERMNRIVRDLLTLSRFDYGKMDWHVMPFQLDTMLQNIYAAMHLEAKKMSHTLTLTFDHTPIAISGDRERLEQVVANILSNAIKYTPQGGCIDMHVKTDADRVLIVVTDNGIGIPAEDIPRLFERFYRVDKARARHLGGTGLGLAIAKEIVETHGGSIEIESTFGKGTTMTVALPLECLL